MERILKPALGNWVSGDRFWGREKDVELLTLKIDEGAHILLTAQRRMGKTSLMRELERRLSDRCLCLFVDLEKARGPEEAVVELAGKIHPHEKLQGRVKRLFSNVLGGIEEIALSEFKVKLRAGLTSGDWTAKGDELFSILADADKPVLLLIDEVPIMINRMLASSDEKILAVQKEEVDLFMSWLRQNAQNHRDRIRMMLSGSIGLGPVLHRAGLSATINHLLPYDLKPWDRETAVGCLRALANGNGVNFKDGAELCVVEKIEYCVPHHIQMFFSHIYDHCKRREDMDFLPSEVETIYEAEMLTVRGHAELSHYEERLKLSFASEMYMLVLELLAEAAVTGRLSSEALIAIQEDFSVSEMELCDALRVLEHDGYLEQTAEGHRFLSPLLRDWWKKRYGQLHAAYVKKG